MSQTATSARVAVITRTKDRPVLLQRALASVAGQRYRDLHWIVVNDGGARAPVQAIVDEAKGAGIAVTLVHNPESLGMEAASNRGVRETDAEYLVIHDDDDSWEADFLSAAVEYLDAHPEDVGVITHATKVTERFDGDSVHVVSRKPYNDDLNAVYLIDLAVVNRFPPISFVFRKAVYDELGGFNEALPVLGDWDFHLRVAARGDIGLIPRALANYHHRLSTQGKNAAYENTVVDGIDKHQRYDAWLRNKWLREDLAAGRFGLGTLVSLARLYNTLRPLVVIASLLSRIKRGLKIRS